MALSPSLVWEVRSTGNSGNGGAFRAGAVGTDYSQQDTAQVVYNDLTVDATTNTKVSSPLNPFQPVHVGNTINISSSTGGWTAGYYEVVSVSSGVATLDRSPAATSTTGGVGKLGGAADSLGTIAGSLVASNVIWIKQGTYTTGPTITLSTISVSPSPSTPPTRLRGYGTARGDNQRATISFTSGYLFLGNGWDVANLNVVGGGTSIVVQFGTNGTISNCKVSGTYSGAGIYISSFGVVYGCEVTGGGAGCKAIQCLGSYGVVAGNYVHDCLGTGIYLSNSGGVVNRNLVANNANEGISINTSGVFVHSNTVHGNGLGGIVNTNASGMLFPVWDNILSQNNGYGVVFAPSQGIPSSVTTDGNAYYGNTSGTRSNGSDTTVNPQGAGGAYTNPNDKVLSASPFVNAAGGDFRLNSTAGGGAMCRGYGLPSSWTGSTLQGYADMGAAQHQESPLAGGGGRIIGSGVVLPARQTA